MEKQLLFKSIKHMTDPQQPYLLRLLSGHDIPYLYHSALARQTQKPFSYLSTGQTGVPQWTTEISKWKSAAAIRCERKALKEFLI